MGRSKVLFQARRRGPWSFFKPQDAIEKKNFRARKAALPLIAVGIAGLTLEAVDGGGESITTVLLMLVIMLLSLAIWWISARIRLTETHLEIRSLGRNKRINRKDIKVLIYDTRVQEARYHSVEDRLAIFMGSNRHILGFVSQNQWGRAVLSALETELDTKVLSFDHEESPPKLGRRYPGLFPWYIQRPILGGLFLAPLIFIAVIGTVALAVLIDEHI